MPDATEALARALHQEYLRERAAAGETRESSASLRDWDDLPHEFRESSRRNAADLCAALRERGYELVEADADAVARFEDGELEGLAQTLHERWVEERAAGGWVHGSRRDDGERRHPDLVPWRELPEERREIDRNLVRQLPSVLRGIGLSLERTADDLPPPSIDGVTP